MLIFLFENKEFNKLGMHQLVKLPFGLYNPVRLHKPKR